MQDSFHLEILRHAVKELRPLKELLVFTGGAVVSTFLDECQYITVRPTKDIDCIVQATSNIEFGDIVKKVKRLGFSEDMNSEFVGRFKKGSLILDMLPLDPKILGFSNTWYKDGLKNKIEVSISGEYFYTLSAPFFLATKMEAFKNRGRCDFLYGHDNEDIITIFDGCSDIAEQIKSSPHRVKKFLTNEISGLLKNRLFLQSIEAHISDRNNLVSRKKLVLDRLKRTLGGGSA